MSIKRFIAWALVLVCGLTGFFLGNMFFRQKKAVSSQVRAAMSYYGSIAFESGQNIENNIWLDMIKEAYGFDVIYDYALPTSQYETKTNTVIATGTISDMFQININQFSMLEKAGLLYEDLTDVYDKYASDFLKESMGWDETLRQHSPNFEKYVVNDKLLAIPIVGGKAGNCNVLYIRKDWLDAVGEKNAPETIEDVEIILTKFKEAGLGKGLGLNQDILFTNAGSADFVFNAYGAYPTLFVEGEDGLVDFGYFRPEIKEALAVLRRWYSQGLIYSEFATSTSDTIGQKCANGEIGMIYGTMSIPLWKGAANVSAIDGADWICCPAPSKDGETMTRVGVTATSTSAYVVRKGYENPERLIQMMNLYIESMYGMTGNFEYFTDISSAFPFKVAPEDTNVRTYGIVQKALDEDIDSAWFRSFEGDPAEEWTGSETDMPAYYGINSEAKFYYRKARSYLMSGLDETGKNWAYTRIFYKYPDENGFLMAGDERKGFDCSFSVIRYYVDNDLILLSAYDGVDTETYSKYRRTLETNISQMMKFIIRGERPLSSFDETIAAMKNGTAKTILQEVNAALGRA